jgi:hypothetical protein
MASTREGVIPHARPPAVTSRGTRHTRALATGPDLQPSLMPRFDALRGVWERDRLAEATTSVGDRALYDGLPKITAGVRTKGWA